MTRWFSLVCMAMLLASGYLAAHHSFAAEFDATRPVTLSGKVVKLEWANPHIWLYIDARGEQGQALWQCEGGAPNSLMRNGWNRNSLKVGDEIVIEGFRARDGSNTCNMRSVKMADGRSLFSGTAPPEAAGR